MALIHSAIHDVRSADAHGDMGAGIPWTPSAYVWGLRMDGTIEITPAPSSYAGLADVRDRINEGDFAALALFDKTSPHWPNPVTWHKSDDGASQSVIAQHLSAPAPAQVSGGFPWGYEIVGGEPWQSIVGGPWQTIVGQALDVLRRQAQAAAGEMPGRVVGVVRDASNQWKLKSFRTVDAADDWFGHATHNPSRFTYAAYFDKDDPLFPHPLNEVIGDAHGAAKPGESIPRVLAEVHP
jgi:hypothetical protein